LAPSCASHQLRHSEDSDGLLHLELLSCSFDLSLLWLGYLRLPTLSYKLNLRLKELAHFNLFDPLF